LIRIRDFRQRFGYHGAVKAAARVRVTRDESQGVPVLRVQGVIDERNWCVLAVALFDLRLELHSAVGLDLSGVWRMSSVGARRLREIRVRFETSGQTLSLLGLSPASIHALSAGAVKP
jgi:anti-anti-sigma regulatory factor